MSRLLAFFKLQMFVVAAVLSVAPMPGRSRGRRPDRERVVLLPMPARTGRRVTPSGDLYVWLRCPYNTTHEFKFRDDIAAQRWIHVELERLDVHGVWFPPPTTRDRPASQTCPCHMDRRRWEAEQRALPCVATAGTFTVVSPFQTARPEAFLPMRDWALTVFWPTVESRYRDRVGLTGHQITGDAVLNHRRALVRFVDMVGGIVVANLDSDAVVDIERRLNRLGRSNGGVRDAVAAGRMAARWALGTDPFSVGDGPLDRHKITVHTKWEKVRRHAATKPRGGQAYVERYWTRVPVDKLVERLVKLGWMSFIANTLGVTTGLRAGERYGLGASHFLPAHELIVVERQRQRGRDPRLLSSWRDVLKDKSSRVVPVPRILAEHLLEPFSGLHERLGVDPMWPLTPVGDGHDRIQVTAAFGDLGSVTWNSVGIRRPWRPRHARHWYATALHDAGVPLDVVGVILGHLDDVDRPLVSRIDTTRPTVSPTTCVYAGVYRPGDGLREAADVIDELFAPHEHLIAAAAAEALDAAEDWLTTHDTTFVDDRSDDARELDRLADAYADEDDDR
jgi:integrase